MSKSYTIVDQRTNPKGKSLPNRQRFIGRQREAIKESIRKKLASTDIKDLGNSDAKRIKVRSSGTKEPTFHHDRGGVTEQVLPGNKKFSKGDRILKPDDVGGDGREGSSDGDGEDDFEFTAPEFLDLVFEGMEIPNVVKKALVGGEEFEIHRAGFSADGPPNKMDVGRTMGRAFGRRLGMKNALKKRKEDLEKELDDIEKRIASSSGGSTATDEQEAQKIRDEIKVAEERLKHVPDIDPYDLRFKRHERVPLPAMKAVMFCMLDVSGSMGEWEKEIAKRFFLLLYLFLTRNYKHVDIVFIRHTQEAKEVDEEEFFHSRETGGTIVSSALALMKMIVEARYPVEEWNIYGCHASDGDNYTSDNPTTFELLANDILPITQYYAYIEVRPEERDTSDLWPVMELLARGNGNIAIRQIGDEKDIYPVFRRLFEKK